MKSETAPQNKMSPQALKDALDRGDVVLIDVRNPDEYKDWHIPGSVNLPLGDILAGAKPPTPPGARLATVCAHGMRSEKARDALAGRGFDVRSVEGGMVAWMGVYDVVPVTSGGTPGAPEVLQFRRVGKGCLSYMVIDQGEAVVIDPTLDVDTYRKAAEARNARITRILDTHGHADHASGSLILAAATGATYHAPPEVGRIATPVNDGDAIPVGRRQIRALLTPGHTPTSTSYVLDGLLFTGDTLFVESVGRPDLGQDPRPNAPTLYRTLQRIARELDPALRVLPGHYGETVAIPRGRPVEATLGELTARIPAFGMSEAAFTEWVVNNTIPKPGNFQTLKQFNGGHLPDADLEDIRELEAGPNRCAVAS